MRARGGEACARARVRMSLDASARGRREGGEACSLTIACAAARAHAQSAIGLRSVLAVGAIHFDGKPRAASVPRRAWVEIGDAVAMAAPETVPAPADAQDDPSKLVGAVVNIEGSGPAKVVSFNKRSSFFENSTHTVQPLFRTGHSQQNLGPEKQVVLRRTKGGVPM